MLKRKKYPCCVKTLFAVVFTVFLAASSLLAAAPQGLTVASNASASSVKLLGDQAEINVFISRFTPLLDKYGKPSVNPDGTFYPNDGFCITYQSSAAENVVFDGAAAKYNQSAFEMLNSTGWGTNSGTGNFKVKSSTTPGDYTFQVTAKGQTSVDLGSEGNGAVTVTHGGVNVDAYYSVEYLLRVSADNSVAGTTNPKPGQYWTSAGANISVTAEPNVGYEFNHWLLDGKMVGSGNAITVNMNMPHALQACFSQASNATANSPIDTNQTGKYSVLSQVSPQNVQQLASASSTVTFTAHGLGEDAAGTALILDNATPVAANQLPVTLSWNAKSTHSYSWSDVVASSSSGVRYVLSHVTAEKHYTSTATLQVEVAAYDPHFTLTLAYTKPNSNGSLSYTKPFAMILRYDGNGPNRNLNERAVIEDYNWNGYASKTVSTATLQQALTSNLTFTAANLLSQTAPVQFTATGVDAKTTGSILTVDGENYTGSQLSKQGFSEAFNWTVSSNHTFTWATELPVMQLEGPGPLGMLQFAPSKSEWLQWEFTFMFPPTQNELSSVLNQTTADQITSQNAAYKTTIDNVLDNALVQQFNSSSGNFTATPLGGSVVAVYSHNKLLNAFADEAGISQSQALSSTTRFPIYFDSESRYAKITFQLNPKVTGQVLRENYTNELDYNVTFTSNMFGSSSYQANYTCPYEYYTKQVNVTTYKWNSTAGDWSIDNAVKAKATFSSAFNFTETEALQYELANETNDQESLRLASEDFSTCPPQTFTGTGTFTEVMNKTSPLYYNLNVTAEKGNCTATVQRTAQIDFTNNDTYILPINMDPSSPLQVNVSEDDIQTSMLTVNAPPELGGLTSVSIYLVTSAPGAPSGAIPVNQLSLKLLKTMNLTQPQTQTATLNSYQQALQEYQYYKGSVSTIHGALGFTGTTQIPIAKDQSMTALSNYNRTLLYVEAKNVWGTTFHTIVAVEPYSIPQWQTDLNEVATYLFILIAIAAIFSTVAYFIKERG